MNKIKKSVVLIAFILSIINTYGQRVNILEYNLLEDSLELVFNYFPKNPKPDDGLQNDDEFDIETYYNNNSFSIKFDTTITTNHNEEMCTIRALLAYKNIFPIDTSYLNIDGININLVNNFNKLKPIKDISNQHYINTISDSIDDYIYKAVVKKSPFRENIKNEIKYALDHPSKTKQKQITSQYLIKPENFNELPQSIIFKLFENLDNQFIDTILYIIDIDSTLTPKIVNRLVESYPEYSINKLYDILKNKGSKTEHKNNEIGLLVKTLNQYSKADQEEVSQELIKTINDFVKLELTKYYFQTNPDQIQYILDSIDLSYLKKPAYNYFENNPIEIINLEDFTSDSIKGLQIVKYFGLNMSDSSIQNKIDSIEYIKYIASIYYFQKNPTEITKLLDKYTLEDYRQIIVPYLAKLEKSSYIYQKVIQQGLPNQIPVPNKDQNPQSQSTFYDDTIDTLSITYNIINKDKSNKAFKSITKKISPYKGTEFEMGIDVNLDVDSLSDKLSHRVNYFNMDKYIGIGGSFYKNFYFNQFCFSAQTRIDSSFKFQPLVFTSLETYWTKGANADFGIVINNFSDSIQFWKNFNLGIYTGGKYINDKKFISEQDYNSYYNWEVGLSATESFRRNMENKYWSVNLKLPITYRNINDYNGITQTAFSPQLNICYNWENLHLKLNIGAQGHFFKNNDLPINNYEIWIKLLYKLNRI